jgi:hypothetical protein
LHGWAFAPDTGLESASDISSAVCSDFAFDRVFDERDVESVGAVGGFSGWRARTREIPQLVELRLLECAVEDEVQR